MTMSSADFVEQWFETPVLQGSLSASGRQLRCLPLPTGTLTRNVTPPTAMSAQSGPLPSSLPRTEEINDETNVLNLPKYDQY